MIEIRSLLLRFNNLLLSEEVKKNSIIDVLHQVVGLQMKPGDIKIKNDVIYLNTKPIYKNEIFLNKNKIFSKLKEKLGKKTPLDIM